MVAAAVAATGAAIGATDGLLPLAPLSISASNTSTNALTSLSPAFSSGKLGKGEVVMSYGPFGHFAIVMYFF